ncbi:MerR family transcriptional regulator [Robiginitomaculum antarcticum]|uniref:MerR family transcriptional regulator n=1 Tax=Robiginitomaculum antarcticum TaxID=437507 RepID=UPI00039D7F50|nr:helix-turn-helix domain-containing protein [Robiginitomaculum antarcticum]
MIKIGELSAKTGVKIETIRYFETIGLMPEAQRKSSGHRVYDEAQLRRLIFISRCRVLGFSQADIRSLLGIDDHSPSCDEVLAITSHHRKTIKSKIADLRKLERQLETISSACLTNDTLDCPIIESLSQIH